MVLDAMSFTLMPLSAGSRSKCLHRHNSYDNVSLSEIKVIHFTSKNFHVTDNNICLYRYVE